MILSLLASVVLAPTPTYLIVELTPGTVPSAVATRDAVVLKDVCADGPFALYQTTSADAAAAQKRLLSDKSVIFAEDDQQLSTMEDVAKGSSVAAVGDRTAIVTLNKISLAQVGWNANLAAKSGRAVRLAILDTGMSRAQKALWLSVDGSFDAFGGTADDSPMHVDSNGNGVADEAVGHGTMVAGIANMVAPMVRLLICKVADSDGNASAWNTIKGLAYAANHGAEVANVSLASPSQVPAFQDVAEWANGKGLLIVAAIGNDARSQAYYPAGSSKSLCVAGLNPNNTKASFSNWNSNTSSSAPAVGIVSQFWTGKLESWSGTSFASPFVAAGVADCLRRGGKQNAKDLIKVVKDTGTKIDDQNKNFKGNLGTLLNISALDARMATKL